jgi:hypothetical protein
MAARLIWLSSDDFTTVNTLWDLLKPLAITTMKSMCLPLENDGANREHPQCRLAPKEAIIP